MLAHDVVSTSLSSSSQSDLHETGSMNTLGQFSLGCVVYSASGLSSYSRDEERDVQSQQTILQERTLPAGLNTPNLLLMFTLPGIAALVAGTHGTQSLITVNELDSHATTTQSSSGLFSWSTEESGRYSNGSYAFSSLVLEQTADAEQEAVSANLATSASTTPNAAGMRQAQEVSTETQTSTLSVQLSAYLAGSDGPSGYNFSSFQLNASLDSASSDNLSQHGSETISGSITDASGTIPSNYKGLSSNTLQPAQLAVAVG